ncbi:unnamed protein product [Linum trigynum]|uniref:Uncharacterized protein n=1 Tax=Linum trigynum TaxID=586398 RepID=A0AAV2DX16_9ROSI
MSSQQQQQQQQQRQAIVKDLVEEAKKRIVILAICVVGLSYLMSLTSSSVWVNLPAATFLIIILRYFVLDLEMRRKSATYVSKSLQSNTSPQDRPHGSSRIVQKSQWRKKVNSPVVEDAINNFMRHIVSEWVTDLWYGRLTPDQEGPEELVVIMNGVLGELSARLRDINLLDLLTRDLINLICTHLVLFRASQAKIAQKQPNFLSIEQRDRELKQVLAAENKLHPALFSPEAEHKVLQHLMEGLISFTFRPDDLKCSFFRYLARELLACAVMRPVLNLATPRFINERIEIFVASKANRGVALAEEASLSKPNETNDHSPRFLDPTGTGVELVPLKTDNSRSRDGTPETDNGNSIHISKDPLLSIDTRSTRSWSSLPLHPQVNSQGDSQLNHSGGQWSDMLDVVSQRKTKALAPENIENMWTKGRNYNKNGGGNGVIEQIPQKSSSTKSVVVDDPRNQSKLQEKDGLTKLDSPLSSNVVNSVGFRQSRVDKPINLGSKNRSNYSMHASYLEDAAQRMMSEDEVVSDSGSGSTHISEEEEEEEEDATDVTGLHSPGTKVWDGKSNRNMPVSHIHHPLENPLGHGVKKPSKDKTRHKKLSGLHTVRKRSRSSAQGQHVWQEVERTSFLSGDGQDVLGAKGCTRADDSTDDSEVENWSRLSTGTVGCSSTPSLLHPEIHTPSASAMRAMMLDSFFKLRCEVLGANIVKSDSKTFAVYSISVTDVNGNSWSIKRRFRHFEELHRRLKEYPEYSLHLPPKHFLSTGLDMPVIQERCTLLDKYLKRLLQTPKISGSIEIWDFLSVDSQTYSFSSSFSIVETLSVHLGDKVNFSGSAIDPFKRKDLLKTEKPVGVAPLRVKESVNNAPSYMQNRLGKDFPKPLEDSGSDSDVQSNVSRIINLGNTAERSESNGLPETAKSLHVDSSIPPEWVPPNLALPLLDLVGVIFQMQESGWIRRKAFWMAKQVLQLGMGDALDDWLIDKIQLLRRGSVIASGIKRVEQILWPDGIFITKHPSRRPPSTVDTSSPKPTPTYSRQPSVLATPQLSEDQQREAERRAKFVYDLMIENAPTAVIGLVGRKEYEQCVKDVYFFIQSPVCLKQLAYDLIELVLLSAFPEMDYNLRQLHEEKSKFGELKAE